MALYESLKTEPDSLHDAELFNRYQSIGRTGRGKTTGRPKENRKGLLIDSDQND